MADAPRDVSVPATAAASGAAQCRGGYGETVGAALVNGCIGTCVTCAAMAALVLDSLRMAFAAGVLVVAFGAPATAPELAP